MTPELEETAAWLAEHREAVAQALGVRHIPEGMEVPAAVLYAPALTLDDTELLRLLTPEDTDG